MKTTCKKAEKYYSSLDTVEYVEKEILFDLCDDGEDTDNTDDADNSISDTLDAKCNAAANSNIDDALKMLDVYYPNPSQINVAVIDTGVENSDLFGDRLVNGEDSISDDLYHGSYVAGTIYCNTSENVVIYSYNATSSSGSISDVLASTSITKAVNQGCDVINMSFGSTAASTTFYNAIKSAYNNGVTIVAAAGNNGYDLDEYDYYPAEYSQVIAVGNMSVANVKYSSSNYNGGVTTYATGINVRSYYRGEEVYWSGTSASSPVIAAAAAIMFSADTSLAPDEIETAIEETEYSPNEDNTYHSIADAYSALSYVTGYELPTAEFEYTVTQNESMGFCDITFTCDDDTRIYYYISSAGLRACPLNTSHFSGHYQWDGESVVSMTKRCYMTMAAYSDTAKKERNILYRPAKAHLRLYNASSSGAITYCSLEDSVIEVPKTISSTEIVSLSKYSFSGMQNLETVILPESVTMISEYTFANCTNLKKVIALGVTQCSRYAFQNCTSLKEVIMPNVTTTYTGMFRNCPSLLICQMGDEEESLSTYNMAFYGSENAINYKLKGYAFAFAGFDGSGNIIIKAPTASRALPSPPRMRSSSGMSIT
ncbi:MAG: S8 family serine peptidase [Clostridiales bacterium]|nr:S8 family serine peptidase [Clostridiales bacterium]